MKTKSKWTYSLLLAAFTLVILMALIIPTFVKANAEDLTFASHYITISDKRMHVLLYGNVSQKDNEVSFKDTNKTTIVMVPALGVPSPHLYYKPIAEALDGDFNMVILEPFGYGLSDLASTIRTSENINSELNEALDLLKIEECILLTHSISGVYGLNFVEDYPSKVKGVIAIDNTIYDEGMLASLEMEKEYMLNGIVEFNTLRDSFSTIEDFKLAIIENPELYGAILPEVVGYTYPESDLEEYWEAYAHCSNENIESEINQLDSSVLSIKDKKFPDSLPVLMMISSANVERVPVWESGHQNQLNLESENHDFYVVEGDHYIWYTNLTGILEHIKEWQTKHSF